MKKMLFVFSTLFLFHSASFANLTAFCADEAGDTVVGLLAGLEQKVIVKKIQHLKTEGKIETHKIVVEGENFSSDETTHSWIVKLSDNGDAGCGFVSIRMSEK
ncbi:MAG: hypothetical protein ACXVCP_20300 [Bdellovibrio sp.]